MLSLLAQGNTGSEILSILDSLIEDNQQSISYTEPTADPIEFWCRRQSVSDTNRGGSGWHFAPLCVRLWLTVNRQCFGAVVDALRRALRI